jgi:hypothetical protein
MPTKPISALSPDGCPYSNPPRPRTYRRGAHESTCRPFHPVAASVRRDDTRQDCPGIPLAGLVMAGSCTLARPLKPAGATRIHRRWERSQVARLLPHLADDLLKASLPCATFLLTESVGALAMLSRAGCDCGYTGGYRSGKPCG